jgi:hypothetical protein
MAKSIVDAHEANLETGRKQAEERQRAIDETARRWPHLEGWRYTDSDYCHRMRRSGYPDAQLSKPDGEIEIGDGYQLDSAVVLALIDAAGRNTTAERLRERVALLEKAINEALVATEKASSASDGCVDACEILNDALEAETWSR